MKKPYTLFIPGPVEMERETLAQLQNPLLYHREKRFAKIIELLLSQLRRVLFMKGKVFILTASGTGAMEACVSNLISRDDKAMVISYGIFGERWRELLWRYGAYTEEVAPPYGQSPPLEEIERRLRSNGEMRFVFTTLTDTSTGMLSNLKEIGRLCRENGRTLIVDAICGLGADEFYGDDWNVDVVCGASQKALACPPGVSFVAVNDRTWEQVEKAKSPRYYFDFRNYERFLPDFQTPFTPAILTLYSLSYALNRITRLGMKKLWEIHRERALGFRKSLKGVEYLPDSPSNALTVIKVPHGKDGTKIIRSIKERYKILLSDGQKALKGKIIRIGHMGNIKRGDLFKVAEILNRYLK